jgi:penicillin-binding protein 1A
MLRKWIGRLLALTVVLAILGGVVGRVLWERYVVDEPGAHLDEDNILKLIAQESPVTYRDGKTNIGVFFADEHRTYVQYEDIPQDWVHGIVSAEDQRYFEHPGVDFKGFTRAMIQNVKAGRVVSGGSTLTMQTSENLFHPGTRDLKGKYWEILDSFRLEQHYTKEQILEFYANQFHVYGNGRGLGIAARYFFDKDVSELTLQESAFLAGLVKIPGRYNPFIGSSEEARELAAQKAVTRTNYVLRRMYEDGWITYDQYQPLVDQPLPFNKGTFRYDSSILLDEVERQLELAPFPEILASAGIDNPSTAGIQIVTTLDQRAQRGATYALWHHLSEAGTSLEGMSQADFFHSADLSPKPDPNDLPEVYGFRYARVTGSTSAGVSLDLGGHPGILDQAAIDRAVKLLAVAQQGDRYPRIGKGDEASLRGALSKDKVVWVSVREQVGGAWLCDLEVRPELQGAVVVLEEGRIVAMVGGNDNRNFNRAVTAKRQLGSTWKILVYNAALQLGWAPTDALDNRRAVFPFTGTWYYPRPDHSSEDFVSISWAGVRSENLATIWLLYHLTDRLNDEQVRRLAELTDLAQRDGEPKQDYIARIRDERGVIATRDRIDDGLFLAVREEVLTDLSFSAYPEDAAEVRSLHYGRGFKTERKKVLANQGGAERELRLRALDRNFLRLEGMVDRCLVQHERLKLAEEPLDPGEVADLHVRPTARGFLVSCGDHHPEGWAPAGEDLVSRLGSPGLPEVLGDPLIDGTLHASTIEAIRDAMERKRGKLDKYEPYDEELLYLHPDFRLVLGMAYVEGLAQASGIEGDLGPVLSMPLGALDVSLLEMANVYQGFLGGERISWPGSGYQDGAVPGIRDRFDVPEQQVPALLIAEVRDREGNVLYRAEPDPVRVSDPVAGRLTVDILRNVVKHGTGRRALSVAHGLPLGGKTGTTNDFKNAAFIGHAPVSRAGVVSWDEAYTVAAYVGYDDNRKMVRNNIKLQGASGALPAWMGTVEALYREGMLGEAGTEEVDADFTFASVVDLSGLPGETDEDRRVLVYGTAGGLERRFAPFSDRAEEIEAEAEALPVDLDLPGQEPEPEQEPEPWDTGAIEAPRLGGPSIWDQLEVPEEEP